MERDWEKGGASEGCVGVHVHVCTHMGAGEVEG